MRMAILATLVFFAGAVDALAGGGGLITLPAYLAAGLDPALLLGTNKFSSCVGTAVSAARYARRLRFDVASFLPVVGASLAGAALGARLSLFVDAHVLRGLVLAAIPLVAAAVYSEHELGAADRGGELSPRRLRSLSLAVAFPIGAYDGFFGPGTGTFLALAFARICRYDLLRATAAAKILNLASNAAALAFFLASGKVHLALGAAMAAMSAAGHYAGSHLGLSNGPRAIRPAILLVLAGLFVKLAFDTARGG